MLKTVAAMIGLARVWLVTPSGTAIQRQQFIPCKDELAAFPSCFRLANFSIQNAVNAESQRKKKHPTQSKSFVLTNPLKFTEENNSPYLRKFSTIKRKLLARAMTPSKLKKPRRFGGVGCSELSKDGREMVCIGRVVFLTRRSRFFFFGESGPASTAWASLTDSDIAFSQSFRSSSVFAASCKERKAGVPPSGRRQDDAARS